MLSAQLDDYAAMLEDAAIVNALQIADTDPASAFEGAILAPFTNFGSLRKADATCSLTPSTKP